MSPRPLHHTRWCIGAIVFRLPLVLDPFCIVDGVSGARREPFASSAATERAYAAPTDDHVMPPWLAAGSSKLGGSEPAHKGARAVREGQQKADTSGKGVQAELIQFLRRLVRVNARDRRTGGGLAPHVPPRGEREDRPRDEPELQSPSAGAQRAKHDDSVVTSGMDAPFLSIWREVMLHLTKTSPELQLQTYQRFWRHIMGKSTVEGLGVQVW